VQLAPTTGLLPQHPTPVQTATLGSHAVPSVTEVRQST
jgi:hypothetical protein